MSEVNDTKTRWLFNDLDSSYEKNCLFRRNWNSDFSFNYFSFYVIKDVSDWMPELIQKQHSIWMKYGKMTTQGEAGRNFKRLLHKSLVRFERGRCSSAVSFGWLAKTFEIRYPYKMTAQEVKSHDQVISESLRVNTWETSLQAKSLFLWVCDMWHRPIGVKGIKSSNTQQLFEDVSVFD